MGAIESMIVGIVLGALICVPIAICLVMFKKLLYICEPNEVLVFEGRKRKLPDGTQLDYTVIHGGRGMRIPVLEQVRQLDLSTMTVHINVSKAYSKGNIPLDVHAIANVKICGRDGIIDNALERFLGLDRAEILEVSKETIEGALRGVIATLTPEQVNEERNTFVQALASDVEDDLNQLGITIDTLNIQSVSDEVRYLDNIGRAQIAAVIRDAEVAESNNKREADQRIADANARGDVADQQAQGNIQRAGNDLRRVKADLEARARSAEERTEQAKYEARARAEVKLQDVRSELERLRLQADEVLPAEAEREAARLLAEGESAIIAAEGEASAEAMRLVSEVWKEAGENAEDIFVLQEIESLLHDVADTLKNVNVSKVQLIDGGDGASLGKLASAYPSMINSLFESLSDATGVEIKDILRREMRGTVNMPRRSPKDKRMFEAEEETQFKAPRYGSRLEGLNLETEAGSDQLLSDMDASSASKRLDEELEAIRNRVEDVKARTTAEEMSTDAPEVEETSGNSTSGFNAEMTRPRVDKGDKE